MKLFPNSKVLLEIGGLSITYYAILILSGAMLAYFISRKNFIKAKKDPSELSDLFFDIIWIGIIGARLWFCAFKDFGYYFTNPMKLIAIWEGGLAIHGGVIFGTAYAYYYCRKKGWNFLKIADMVVPNVLLAQAIGRWGNFINQEAHGKEVAESFFNGPLNFLKEGMFIGGKYYYPTFFFESTLNIIGFILIAVFLKKTVKKRGQLFYSYFMWYGVVRFFIEYYRTDALLIGGLKIAQIISIVSVIFGLLGYYGFFEKFMPKEKPTVIFDLDGTIIDTEQGIIDTYAYLFEKYDDPKNFTEKRKMEILGPSLYVMFPKYFKGHDVHELIEDYRQYNAKIFKDVNKLMPNAEYVIKSLREQGYNLAIVSTKFNQVIRDNLKLYDLEKYFSVIVGIDDVSKEKPDPEGLNKVFKGNSWNKDDVIYIGDSPNDILAGKAANCYTVGYYFNEKRKDNLDKVKPHETINDLKDVLIIVEKNIYFTNDGK